MNEDNKDESRTVRIEKKIQFKINYDSIDRHLIITSLIPRTRCITSLHALRIINETGIIDIEADGTWRLTELSPVKM